MTLNDIWAWIEPNPLSTAIIALSLVEVVPIKINPWKWLFTWIGNVINKEVMKKIDEIDVRLDTFEGNQNYCRKIQNEKWATDCRWSVLDFSDSVKLGKKHTKEAWEHVMSQLREYGDFCRKNEIDNDRMIEETKYLREVYERRVRKNDWLVAKPERED